MCVISAGCILHLVCYIPGLCYTELRARIYRIQSNAYEYIYRTFGEAAAFIAGWLLVLRHITCSSALARVFSANLDVLTGNRISNFTASHVGRLPYLHSNLDVLAFCVCLLVLAISVWDLLPWNHTARMTLNAGNLLALLFMLVLSLYHLDFGRWSTTDKFFSHSGTGVGIRYAKLVLRFSASKIK